MFFSQTNIHDTQYGNTIYRDETQQLREISVCIIRLSCVRVCVCMLASELVIVPIRLADFMTFKLLIDWSKLCQSPNECWDSVHLLDMIIEFRWKMYAKIKVFRTQHNESSTEPTISDSLVLIDKWIVWDVNGLKSHIILSRSIRGQCGDLDDFFFFSICVSYFEIIQMIYSRSVESLLIFFSVCHLEFWLC